MQLFANIVAPACCGESRVLADTHIIMMKRVVTKAQPALTPLQQQNCAQ